ncbi:MAG: hypothetical protein ABJB93_02210 [Gaiellales bacterium]
MRRRRLLEGLRRFALAVAGAIGVTAAVSLLVGVLTGSSVLRSLAVGFYMAGALFLLLGFFFGTRPPVRQDSSEGAFGSFFGGYYGRGPVRFANPEERDDAISSSAVFVTLGFVLLLFGVLFDRRHPLT